ncbi:homoserine O-acetyltransferase MetX [Hirschia litorea]|uniref:Homoserine O-acetyltransferase n=1 Tax=Hirschia litorea TaxID=1199156 RepID=A0ABW2IKZ6_9PROT
MQQLKNIDGASTLRRRRITHPDKPLQLDSGETLAPVDIAFETWGTLSPNKDNVIVVCHALTGDQFPAGSNPITERPAWWPRMIGPGLPVDTNRFYVIATNVLGGCMGSTGPASLAPDGEPYGLRFPTITIADMVRAQIALLDNLGIDKIFCVMGGSMGGMQVLEWARQAGDRVQTAIPIATSARQSAQNIGFYEVGRQAIMADPNWCDGAYLAKGTRPDRGLGVARMAAHITYVSEEALKQKFDRRLQNRDKFTFGFDADFQIESYLRYQGATFVDRFDANSYLYITRAMDYFDLLDTENALSNIKARICVFSFSSDWHYTPDESKALVRALNAADIETSYVSLETTKGHDAFLLEEPEFEAALAGFISSAADTHNIAKPSNSENGGAN